MKKNKKGFTLVELVIVIAVIAILAGVLIPTFSNVIENANKSAALQEARSVMVTMIDVNDGKVPDEYYITSGNYTYKVTKGQINDEPTTVPSGYSAFADAAIPTDIIVYVPTTPPAANGTT